jgi:hypothetical protein
MATIEKTYTGEKAEAVAQSFINGESFEISESDAPFFLGAIEVTIVHAEWRRNIKESFFEEDGMVIKSPGEPFLVAKIELWEI